MPATPETPARYFALLYSPAPQRLLLESLFGIEREVSASLRPGLDHQVAHTRLSWWREECERAVAGKPVHPLTRALVGAFDTTPAAEPTRTRATPLPWLEGLPGIVDVAIWDLAGATFESRRELTVYCERWAAAMIEPMAAQAADVISGANTGSGSNPSMGGSGASTGHGDASAGGSGASTGHGDASTGGSGASTGHDGARAADSGANLTHWCAFGAALRETELLTDLAREAHHGRLRVPLDELEGARADPGVLAKPPWPESVAELIRARRRSLRDEIARMLGNVDRDQQPALRGLLVWAALASRASERADRALPERQLPGRLDPLADAWLAWRIARRATIGRFRMS